MSNNNELKKILIPIVERVMKEKIKSVKKEKLYEQKTNKLINEFKRKMNETLSNLDELSSSLEVLKKIDEINQINENIKTKLSSLK